MQVKVSDTVHAYLRDAILSGELAPGDAVPSERELSDRLHVNRHAVREALNRLQQARLVQITHGGATRVLDWRTTGGLELIMDLARDPSATIAPSLIRAIVELRACIGVDAARRCAERASPELRHHVATLAETAAETQDLGTRSAANTTLWTALVDGADNIAYRLALNTLLEGVAVYPELDALMNTPAGDADHYAALADALRAGDADSASDAARQILEQPLRRSRRRPPPAWPRGS
jgi:DNA-binding FadR family transcriptional regulator